MPSRKILAAALALSLVLLTACRKNSPVPKSKDALTETKGLTASVLLDKDLRPLPGCALPLAASDETGETPPEPIAVPIPEDAGVDLWSSDLGLLKLTLPDGSLTVRQEKPAAENGEFDFFTYGKTKKTYIVYHKISDTAALSVICETDDPDPAEIIETARKIAKETKPSTECETNIDGVGLDMEYVRPVSLENGIFSLRASDQEMIYISAMSVTPRPDLKPMDTGGTILYGGDWVHEETGLWGWVLPGSTGNLIILASSGRELMGIFLTDSVDSAPEPAPGSR